jgi:hypothetical protein
VGPGRRAWGRPCLAVAGLGLEPESGSRSGTTPTGGSQLSTRGRRGQGSWCAGGPLGRGGSVGPAAGLGRAVEGRRERKASLAGPCGEEREKRKAGWAWAAWKKRERKKRKREWAGPKKKKREKKNCIQMHLNLNLKFKFKWKTNNKTMQYGMKCTRPIIPYISFYG